jgi:hypothetical protein
MAATRRAEISLIALAWVGLTAAFIGVLSTPRDYCGEFPTPRGELAVEVGLPVAFVATAVAVSIESFRHTNVRTTVAWLAIGLVTFGAMLGVGFLEAGRVASWGCA